MNENDTVYLKNGQAVNFVKKIDENNYIVEPFMIFHDYEGNEDYEHGDKIVVSKIFSKPPVEKIEKEYLEKIEAVKGKIEQLSLIAKEVQAAERKLRLVKEETTDLKNNIINKSELKEAEAITVFLVGDVEPRTLSKKMKKELKIEIEINLMNGQEKVFAYNFYDYDESWGSSEKIDLNFGLMLDITEEELLKLSKDRSDKMYDSESLVDYRLKSTDNKFLSDRLIKIKNKILEGEKSKKKEDLKNEIKKKRDELLKLERNLN
jgi:hypothetical protein